MERYALLYFKQFICFDWVTNKREEVMCQIRRLKFPSFFSIRKSWWYFFAPLHRSHIDLVNKKSQKYILRKNPCLITWTKKILVLFFKSYDVVCYSNRGRKCKWQDVQNIDPGFKRSRKEAVNYIAQKVLLVQQQSKYHNDKYGKIVYWY